MGLFDYEREYSSAAVGVLSLGELPKGILRKASSGCLMRLVTSVEGALLEVLCSSCYAPPDLSH